MKYQEIKKTLPILFSILFFAGCNNTDSPKGLNVSNAMTNDSCRTATILSKRKIKIGRGEICNGMKNGIWMEWDTSGNFLWEGEYNQNHRSYFDSITSHLTGKFIFNDVDSILKKDMKYTLLISTNRNDIHPMDLMMYSKDGGILTQSEFKYSDKLMECVYLKRENKNYYYEFTPRKTGNMNLDLYFTRFSKGHFVDDSLFEKHIKVIY